jgi:hypothetical protein
MKKVIPEEHVRRLIDLKRGGSVNLLRYVLFVPL